MGRKSGAAHSGAVGKRRPLPAKRRTDEDVNAALEADDSIDIRTLARQHSKEALGTLVEIMRDKDVAPNVRRQSAKDVMEVGHDRPAVRDPGERQNSLTVIVNQLSVDGPAHTIEHAISQAQHAAEGALAALSDPTPDLAERATPDLVPSE